MNDLTVLPPDLPVPEDDGACDHLLGVQFPSVTLLATSENKVNISANPGLVVVYFYPLIGRPDSPPMPGWNEIPGARGCTPQSCAFRDLYAEFTGLGVSVYGVSVQSHSEQVEASQRLHLPFELVSDFALEIASALRLPTFEYNSSVLIKRLTLIVENGIIKKVFYPVFPPTENAANVMAWIKDHRA
ncbi:peroxiredoxin [Cellvibrio mixtus]|uniref:peroxiredoxin n=1 Tax=Cellvibrio mixtus TaxID=39650 RepID=UPI0005867F85|nr:peroxiredoxin [Cellvibrio mixtus]